MMTRDQALMKRLQQRLANWNPDELCNIHFEQHRCVYDEQGRLIQLHLCELDAIQIPSEVWQCSSLQSLALSFNRLSSLPAELGQHTSLRWLGLHNASLSLPPDIVVQDAQAILLCLRAGKRPQS